MKDNYKGHMITATARQIRETQQWQPRLVIWTAEGDYPIKAPVITESFATREQAESEGLVLAKQWIDYGKPSVF